MIVANKNKIVKLAENLTADEQTSGRSLWADARTRFMRNKAAITSLVILVLIVLFSFVGPYFAVWTYEQIDWNTMGSAATLGMPSIETGHYFGTDDLGRDPLFTCYSGYSDFSYGWYCGCNYCCCSRHTLWCNLRLYRWQN